MSEKTKYKSVSRRHFLNTMGFGGAGIIVLGSMGFTMSHDSRSGVIRAIVVDFTKCSGCRTCEAACSEFNHKVDISGKWINGLANPNLSNIRVHHYNPDIDIPSTCALCDDAPCVATCPVEPAPGTGFKALYRDPESMVIMNDTERCIGCQSCYFACSEKRAGVIRPNPETGSPERICSLCNGNPQCVENCPYDALEFLEMEPGRKLDGLKPEEIASRMIKDMYNLKLEEV